MITQLELKEHLENLVNLQIRLVSALKNQYPDIQDWELLLDLPKRGTLLDYGDNWEFRRHGRGVCFQQHSPRERVIDVHHDLNHPEQFDTWRLIQYLEALGWSESEESVAQPLRELMAMGMVSQHEDKPKSYTLEKRFKRNLLVLPQAAETRKFEPVNRIEKPQTQIVM